MTNPVMVAKAQFRTVDGADVCEGQGLWVWCPGCDMAHRPMAVGEDRSKPSGPCWEWDGNLDSPTISPSLLVYDSVRLCSCGDVCEPDCPRTRGNCHSFIRAGHWEFLGDCAHPLAGQTVPMVPLPDWLIR